MPPLKVLIAGGGIGGLALAAAGQRLGLGCEVFERTRELRPVGAGITVQMNAILALASAGIDGPVRAAGHVPVRADVLLPSGRLLQSLDLAAIARDVGAPAYTITRARLHEALLSQVDPATVHLAAAVTGYTETDAGVEVALADGRTVAGDVLVGADGLHSAVRAQLLGDEPTRYAGYTSWRGLCRDPEVGNRDFATETWGRGLRFGVVPLGRDEVYWFAVANAPAGAQLAGEAVKQSLTERFGAWHAPIPGLIERTPAGDVLHTEIADRATRTTWGRGRVVLLGDAIHPMTPNLGQGGGQAIEDAVVLAAALAAGPDVATALASYHRRRVERANAVVVESRRIGAVAQWQNPIACALRDVGTRLTPTGWMRRRVTRAMRFPG